MPRPPLPPFYYGRQQNSQNSPMRSADPAGNMPRQMFNASQSGVSRENTLSGRSERETLPVFSSAQVDPYNAGIEYRQQRNPEIGFLRLRISTARGELPVNGATVTIFKCGDPQKRAISTQHTDYNGITDPIPLQAPDQTSGWNPQHPKPYESYAVFVEHPEYGYAEAPDIPVFAGVTSVQQIRMESHFPAAGAYPWDRFSQGRAFAPRG